MSVREGVDGQGRKRFRVYVYDSFARKSVYVGTFDRAKDAREAEYEAKRRMRLGEPIRPKPAREEITFDALARRWIDGLNSVRPSTKVDYRQAIQRLKPCVGGTLVSELTRRDIDEAISYLSARYSPSTTRKTITVAKMVLRVAVDWDLIDVVPTAGTKLPLPKVRKRTFRPLTSEEVSRLLDAAPSEWRVFYLLLVTTGLRRAEAWGLTLGDIDLQAGFIDVRRQLVDGRLEELKTDAARRRIPLPRPTVEALTEHLRSEAQNPHGLVFASAEGHPIDPSNWYARVHRPTREKAGLPSLRLHDLRHQFCSMLLASGRSVKYVQTVAGHVDASTTLNVYGWLLPGEEEKAVADLEDWLALEDLALYVTFSAAHMARA